MGAALAERKDTAAAASTTPASADGVVPQSPTSSAANAARQKRSRRRSSRALAAQCLSPRSIKGECAAARGANETHVADPLVLASHTRRRNLMAQLTGEEMDALLMREVLLQVHRKSSHAGSELSDNGSFDWCSGSAAPSCCSSQLAAGVRYAIIVPPRSTCSGPRLTNCKSLLHVVRLF